MSGRHISTQRLTDNSAPALDADGPQRCLNSGAVAEVILTLLWATSRPRHVMRRNLDRNTL